MMRYEHTAETDGVTHQIDTNPEYRAMGVDGRDSQVEVIPAQENAGEFIALVKEYTDMISAQEESVAGTLSYQRLDKELADVGEKYGKPVGCIALAGNDDDYCEMKRLYVRQAYRGSGFSRLLCERVIEDAKSIGYKYMRLDTFPFMRSALRLYEKLGFGYIEKYNNPAEDAIFMQLSLR
jgi:ribosomal protein S18 acetylase RimI-like enzyme